MYPWFIETILNCLCKWISKNHILGNVHTFNMVYTASWNVWGEWFLAGTQGTYVELHQCPSHHSILLTQGRIWEIFTKNFWELAILKNELFLSRPFWIFLSKKKIFFCFIPMKISPNLYGRMDGSKFWCFPWFPENSLLCVILRYTVYEFKGLTVSSFYILFYSSAYCIEESIQGLKSAKLDILPKLNRMDNFENW